MTSAHIALKQSRRNAILNKIDLYIIRAYMRNYLFQIVYDGIWNVGYTHTLSMETPKGKSDSIVL
jgi:hypothetical protein